MESWQFIEMIHVRPLSNRTSREWKNMYNLDAMPPGGKAVDVIMVNS